MNRTRIHRDYAPLNISVAIKCDSAFSPMTQVYNPESAEFEPNRILSPTVIRPVVNASAADGTWPDHSANSHLAGLKWYVNGSDIETLASWQGQYRLEYSGENRGSLTIYKNIQPSEVVSLHFEANLVDTRAGLTYRIRTDDVILSTIDKAKDSAGISLGDASNIRYTPMLDKLSLYEYKVAHQIISPSSAAEQACRDGNEYDRVIPIEVYNGGSLITSGYTIKLYKVVSAADVVEVTANDHEVVSVSNTAVHLDMRLITKADYLIKAFIDGQEEARAQIAINRVHPQFSISPVNESGILPTQIERYDEVQVISNDRVVEYPGHSLKIVWYTDTAAKVNVQHNEGGTTIIDLKRTGLGSDYTNDWLDIYVEAVQKPAHCVAASSDGDIYTDENGNILIFN